jgi:antitoxin component of MazEF toxin-antitoxin module
MYILGIYNVKGVWYTLVKKDKKGMVYMTTATVRRWGNSLAVRIPQEVANRVGFEDGLEVQLIVNENREVTMKHNFPAADDQDTLRKHFLALREKCKESADRREEVFAEPMGDEIL